MLLGIASSHSAMRSNTVSTLRLTSGDKVPVSALILYRDYLACPLAETPKSEHVAPGKRLTDPALISTTVERFNVFLFEVFYPGHKKLERVPQHCPVFVDQIVFSLEGRGA